MRRSIRWNRPSSRTATSPRRSARAIASRSGCCGQPWCAWSTTRSRSRHNPIATVTKLDYYEVLQVSRTASDQELKSAYRKLAMQFHPDRNPGNAEAEERFKECSEAYQVLSDPDKRAAYDRYGHAGVGGAGPSGNPFANAQDIGDIFGDIFGEMFGGGSGRRGGSRAQRGRDLRFDQTITFEDAVFGKEV